VFADWCSTSCTSPQRPGRTVHAYGISNNLPLRLASSLVDCHHKLRIHCNKLGLFRCFCSSAWIGIFIALVPLSSCRRKLDLARSFSASQSSLPPPSSRVCLFLQRRLLLLSAPSPPDFPPFGLPLLIGLLGPLLGPPLSHSRYLVLYPGFLVLYLFHTSLSPLLLRSQDVAASLRPTNSNSPVFA
jgi:hypothetical protein